MLTELLQKIDIFLGIAPAPTKNNRKRVEVEPVIDDTKPNPAHEMIEYYDAIPILDAIPPPRQEASRKRSKAERAHTRAIHNQQRKAKRIAIEGQRAAKRAKRKAKRDRDRVRLNSRNFGKQRVAKYAALNPKRLRHCDRPGACVHMKTAGEAFNLSGDSGAAYPTYEVEIPWVSTNK